MSNLNQILSTTVQTQVRQAVTIYPEKVVQLVKKSIAGEMSEYTWNGQLKSRPVDSDCLRHQASNYNSITSSGWYISLKKEYGEAIHLLLKVYINNQINNYLVSCVGREFTSASLKTRERIEELNAEIETLQFEVDSLQRQVAHLEQEVEEVKVKNFDLEVEVHGLSKTISNWEVAFARSQRTIDVSEERGNKLEQTLSHALSTLNAVESRLELTSTNLHQTKIELQETKIELQETKIELQETKVELQETKVELQETKVELQETKVKLESIDERLRRLENKDWRMEIGTHNITEAREMVGNGIRDTYIIAAELTENAEKATSESAPTIRNNVQEVKDLVEEMNVFTLRMEPFTSITAEIRLLDALSNQCFSVSRKLHWIILNANNLTNRLKLGDQKDTNE